MHVNVVKILCISKIDLNFFKSYVFIILKIYCFSNPAILCYVRKFENFVFDCIQCVGYIPFSRNDELL